MIGSPGEQLGTSCATEGALSEQYEQINARKGLKTGVERLLFVCETKEPMEKLRQRIGAMAGARAKAKLGFKLVSDYLEDE
jgi:hypothetical protein